jgi:protein-S-isoprenylcysteine O-methyltransferase Ste14
VLHVLAPIERIVPRELFWAGAAVALGGLALSNVASIRLRRAGTPLESDLIPTALLTDGVFRVSRNPVYLGMLLLLAGEATMLGTVGAMLPWPAFYALLRWRFIGVEERVLLATFGERYARYRTGVRRWL